MFLYLLESKEIRLISKLSSVIKLFILEKFLSLDLSSTIIVFILIFGYLFLQNLIDFISDFKDLRVYSILGNSNSLFLF